MHLGCFMIYLTHFVTLHEVSPSVCLLVSFFTNTRQKQQRRKGSQFERIQSAWQRAQDCRSSRQLIIIPTTRKQRMNEHDVGLSYRALEPALVIYFLPQGSTSYRLKTFPKPAKDQAFKHMSLWESFPIQMQGTEVSHSRTKSLPLYWQGRDGWCSLVTEGGSWWVWRREMAERTPRAVCLRPAASGLGFSRNQKEKNSQIIL